MTGPNMRACVLAIGQSNIANYGAGREASAFGRVLYGNSYYKLADPVPGASGELGSVWPRFAEQLRTSGRVSELILCMAAKGGTSVADWATGPCRATVEARVADMKAMGQIPTHVIYHQGERDTHLDTGTASYLESFGQLYQRVCVVFPGVPWIVCRASYRFGIVSGHVRAAQNQIPELYANCRRGPDTDTFGPEYRRDNTHFNERGLTTFAGLLAEAVMQSGAEPDQAGIARGDDDKQ